MSTSQGVEKLEKLDHPPITEVVCGIAFPEMPGLDPLLVGTYWTERRKVFPTRQLRAAASEDGVWASAISLPLRSMLFSEDTSWVIQIQPDRFYVNWRRTSREAEYPRFSDKDGQPGVETRLFNELDEFTKFCARPDNLGAVPMPNRIELAKLDLLIEGLDWDGFGDLAALLPWLRNFAEFSESAQPTIALRFDEPCEGGTLTVLIASAIGGPGRAIKLESRVVLNSGGSTDELRARFRQANDHLNRIFGRLIPKSERQKRFNSRGEGK